MDPDNKFKNVASVITSALVLSGIGALYYNMLPLYFGMAQDSRQLTNSQIGALGFAFFLGYNLLMISAFFWIRKVNWRLLTLVSLSVCIVSLCSGVWIHNYEYLFLSNVVAGAAFSALYGLGAIILGDTEDPARWYGAKIAFEAAIGAVLFLILPSTLIADRGFEGLIIGMVIAIILLSPMLLMVPSHGVKTEDYEAVELAETKAELPRLTIWMTLIGTLLFFGSQTTIWAFIERIGSIMDFDLTAVGNLLSGTLLCALSGSIVATYLGSRFGNIKPLIFSGGLFLVAILGLSNANEFIFYAISSCLVMFSVGYGIPYAFSEIADLDCDGRYVVLAVPAIGIGAMLGPSTAGMLADGEDFSSVLLFGAVTIIIAVLLLANARGFMPATEISLTE